MSEQPIENWHRLRLAGKGDGVIEVPSFPTEVSTGYGLVRFALGPRSEPRLLVPTASNTRLPLNGEAGRLKINLSKFVLAGRNVSFLDLMSNDRALDAVFAELAMAIINRAAIGTAPSEAVERTILEFRELLLESEAEAVSSSAIYGLVGELVVLRELSAIAVTAVQSWIGPYEERHDFRRGLHAIEVKASSRADASIVSISSIDQLTEPLDGTLSLVHVRLERSDQGALSVSQLHETLLSIGVDQPALDRGLAKAKCKEPKGRAWNRLKFNLEHVSTYRVAEGFPRINSKLFTGNTLPSGISRVQYSLDLQAAASFALSKAEASLAYQRFLG